MFNQLFHTCGQKMELEPFGHFTRLDQKFLPVDLRVDTKTYDADGYTTKSFALEYED